MRGLGTSALAVACAIQTLAIAAPLLQSPDGSARESNNLVCPAPCEVQIAPPSAKAFEPTLTAARGRLVLASSDFDGLHRRFMDRWLHVRVSDDEGSSWNDVMVDDAFPSACATLFDPVAASLPNGHLFVGGVAYRRDPVFSAIPLFGTLVLARVSDQGTELVDASIVGPEPTPLAEACSSSRPPQSSADKPFLVGAPDGSLFASWSPTATQDAAPRIARSRDEGRTWTTLPPLAADEGVPYSVAIAVNAAGTVAVAFTRSIGGEYRGTYVAVLAGTSWRVTQLDAAGGPYPAIAWGRGPTANGLFVVYPRTVGAVEAPMIRWSTDQGRTWSDSVSLDVPEAKGATVPSVAVDGRGRAFSGFYHAFEDGSNEYRVSAIDGARPMGPITVNASPIGHQDLSLSLGHYMGIVGLDSGAFASWVGGQVPRTSLMGARIDVGVS